MRDAAAYVLWALARTQNPATLKPHAANLANRLASVAIYDREIHIRRAASAAYQEHVGRMVSDTHRTSRSQVNALMSMGRPRACSPTELTC